MIRTVTLVLTLGDSEKDIHSSGTVERKSVLEIKIVSLENLAWGLYERFILIAVFVTVQHRCTKLEFQLKKFGNKPFNSK